MVNWIQLADYEQLFDDVLELKFKSPNGEYQIVLEPQNNEELIVRHKNESEIWPIMTKAKFGKNYKVCGLADWVPNIVNEVAWFELIIGEKTSITFWGNQVINRVDAILN